MYQSSTLEILPGTPTVICAEKQSFPVSTFQFSWELILNKKIIYCITTQLYLLTWFFVCPNLCYPFTCTLKCKMFNTSLFNLFCLELRYHGTNRNIATSRPRNKDRESNAFQSPSEQYFIDGFDKRHVSVGWAI